MNIPIWHGSSSFANLSASYYVVGTSTVRPTAFGYYDSDATFKVESDKVADWCARKLGYPILQVELQDINFYTALEEAVTEFSTQVNMMNAKDYMMTLVGTPTTNQLSQRVITPNLGRTVSIDKQYGSLVGSGGDVD